MNINTTIDYNIISSNIRQNKYRYIGSGSGRRVFDLGNGYIIKVAKNRKGIAQNEVESQISKIDKSGFFARVIGVSEKYEMLIMEKAERILHYSDILNYYSVKNNRELLQLDGIKRGLNDYHLIWQDLCRLDSWGLIKGKPVIIDYGFTYMVKKKYYFPF